MTQEPQHGRGHHEKLIICADFKYEVNPPSSYGDISPDLSANQTAAPNRKSRSNELLCK